MGFANIWDSVMGYFTSGRQESEVKASLDLFKKYLNGTENKIIRMWVPSTFGYGHQSSTVNLIFQLTNSAANNGFEYAGTIELYYAGSLDDDLEKLFKLMPSLNNQTTGGKVNQATVNLIKKTNNIPSTRVHLAFTGGNEIPGDLAKMLNSDYYLQLQPYMWNSDEELQFLDATKNTISLTKQRLLSYGAFKQRGYWIQLGEVPDWTYFRQNGYKNQVDVLENIISNIDKYDIGVTYSIRTDSELRSPPQERMFDVITGYLASQMNGANIRSGAKPIIVVSMDRFTDATGGAQTKLQGLISGKLTAKENEWLADKSQEGKTKKGENILTQRLKPSTYRQNYLNSKNVRAKERVSYVWDATLTNLQDGYKLLDNNKKVLFVQVGRVPSSIFNYLMLKSTLPPIFEGQNTGNLAMQLGMPYFHVARPNSSTVQYPTTLLGYTVYNSEFSNTYIPRLEYVPGIVYRMQQIANKVNFPLEKWPSETSNNPAEVIGTFIKNYKDPSGKEYRAYYKSVADFYQNPANDKFRIGASYLGYILQSNGVLTSSQNLEAASTSLMVKADTNPLAELLLKLNANLDNTTLDLFPGVYSAGPIFDFISGLLGINLLLSDATITPDNEENPTEILVKGGSSVLDNTPLEFAIVFTAPQGSVISDWKMTYAGTWLTDELPWLLFEKPYVGFTVADTIIPAQGSVGGILQGLDLDLSIRLPINDGLWQLEGHFEEPASVSKFYQLAGGVNLVQALPSPFNAFSAIGVTDCQLAYNSTTNSIEYVSFEMATSESVQLMQGLTMDSITFNVLVQEPGSLTNRSTSWSIAGKFTIGTGEDAGVIITGMKYPSVAISGQLVSGIIKVTDLFNLFLPGTVFDPEGDTPAVTEFQASFEGTTGNYNVVSKLNFDWTFQILPDAPSLTINDVGVRVKNVNTKLEDGSIKSELEGGISGGFTFNDKNGDPAFSISLSANYATAKGWVFLGQQTPDTVLDLSALANQLLPASWQIPPEYDYKLKNLNFKFEENTKFYELGGETDGFWAIPFIDLRVRADLKFGFGLAKSESKTSSDVMILDSRSKPLRNTHGLVVAEAEEEPNYYCTLNADIDWIGIKMKVFIDYAPPKQTYRFIWNKLTGEITQANENAPWIGTLKFTESVTLGSIVEEAIGWFTGYKYSLSSPWDLLNSLPLDALELNYNFTDGTVSFNLNIGPINLGFCRIDSIGIEYNNDKGATDQSKNQSTKKNGVYITIKGRFYWIFDNETPGQSPDEISWDASKPETAPSPSGQGNKYLDLRLLALGQHVTIPAFADANSVQDAIDAMAELPLTKPGEIPGITFDPNSSWLVGMNFGILKLGGDSTNGAKSQALATTGKNGANEAKDSGYFIDMQIVFNDPHLYALRIKLSGEPARIFKGLDFQIMYRKISDSIGVYQGEIALPDIMRKIQLGQVNITLPVFGFQIYTNGDFLIDLGFPWNADFSRSFTLQTIIWVGPVPIPVMGSAGIYFGKKSSATSTEVPKISNGTFNPVILFGVGIEFGLGYDLTVGILAAGFKLTIVAIIEGVIAKFNPYQLEDTSTGNQADISPSYYYSIKGVVGIQGKLFGYVDFKIIKAEVTVLLNILAEITIAAYRPIELGFSVEVSVSVSVKIDLGLFSIKISFSFKMELTSSFEIQVGSTNSPWHVVSEGQDESLRVLNTTSQALCSNRRARSMAFLATIEDAFTSQPTWANLDEAAAKAPLTGYLGLGPSMAGDTSTDLASQQAVYSAMLFIESTASSNDAPDSAVLKADGTTPDTSFEVLAKQIFRWVIAAFYNESISAADVDKLPISLVRLQEIFDYLNNPDNSDPIPITDIDDFLTEQVSMTITGPNGSGTNTDAAYFPVNPKMNIVCPSTLTYSFGGYNALSETYIHDLREYFNSLSVKMNEDQNSGDIALKKEPMLSNTESLATFIFADYFQMLGRQMVQNALNSLATFHYRIVAGQKISDITTWINAHGQFGNGYSYTINDLFDNNKSHVLTTDKTIKVIKAKYATVSNDTFSSISTKAMYNGNFDGNSLAVTNANNTTILQSGYVVHYPEKDSIVIQSGNTLDMLSTGFEVTLPELLANAKIENDLISDAPGLLMPSSKLDLPDFSGSSLEGDTLTTFSARYGVMIAALADNAANAAIEDLFSINDNNGQLIISDLPQFEVGELIKEIQANQGLQQLSGMASRYYLSGLRLPTLGITPKYKGMWVNDQLKYDQPNAGLFALTGQQFPLPVLAADESFDIKFSIPASLTWMSFNNADPSVLDISIKEDSDLYQQIDAIRTYAQGNYLDLDTEQLGLGDMFSCNFGHYTFSTASLWQAGSPILLPYDGVINSSQIINIWALPNDLLSLADPEGRAITPKFEVQIGALDPATQHVAPTPITNFGWGTQVVFTVKKVPVSEDSPASETTYEISGADGNNALILEKMVTNLKGNDDLIDFVSIGFTPDQSNGTNPGIQTDPISDLTIGIAQANLSTFTRPDAASTNSFAQMDQNQTERSNLLNTPTALIQLLWQASITRDGGYFLYYFNKENGEGLPDHAFNDKGEALLSLVIIYTNPDAINGQNLLQPYMNIFVTGNPINVNDSTVYAKADPVPQNPAFGKDDTLSEIAFRYFTNIADVVENDANLSALLTAGLTIKIPQGTYQVRNANGETLESIASKFDTTEESIKAANPVVNIWPDPLPLYFGLRLPSSLTITVSSDVNTKTLAAISTFYGMDLAALGNYNSNVPNLFVGGTILNMTGGPVTRVSTMPAGVVALDAIIKEPEDIPETPPFDAKYSKIFLQHNFSILSFSLINNSWFIPNSDILSLPAGPTDSKPDTNNPCPGAQDLSDKWVFKQAVPYYKFANYQGILSAKITSSTEILITFTEALDPASAQNISNYQLSPELSISSAILNTEVTVTLTTEASLSDNLLYLISVTNIENEANTSTFTQQAALDMPGISTSPYKGVGYLVQADFNWLDIYGNSILTTLSSGTADILNKPPILTGYTDVLLGVNQWPSVTTVWGVDNANGAKIQIPMTFDSTKYNGLLSAIATNNTTVKLTFTEPLDNATATTIANYKLNPEIVIDSVVLDNDTTVMITLKAAMTEDLLYTVAIGNIQNKAKTVTFNGQATFNNPDVPAVATSSLMEQAEHDFLVYTQLWYQLTDPNGMEISMNTSLYNQDFLVSPTSFNALLNWISSIYNYLRDRSQGGTTVPQPTTLFTFDFPIDPSSINPAQIIELVLSLSISRMGGAVMGDFETTGSVKKVTTLLSPTTTSGENKTSGLDAFAESFENIMSISGQYYLKISTGADRDKLGQQKPDGTIWAVRLGIDDAAPIAYKVKNIDNPNLFAPKPISNKLESRTQVPIYTYSTGVGISPTISYHKDFTEIDLDQWIGSFFGSIDDILTPEFTASIQLIDKKLNKTYLDDIQQNKEDLAEIAKLLMVTVFEGETADATSVQEALKQALLVKLTNLYATKSGILFDIDVNSDTVPQEIVAPNLFGNFIQNTVLEGAISEENNLTTVTLHFNAPLDPASAADTSNYSLSEPLVVDKADISSDGQSVLLTASEDVEIGVSTVTILNGLLDSNKRQIEGTREETIKYSYVSNSKPDQLTISSAKIKLDNTNNDSQSLAFLLSAPEIVRGQEGEVLSEINLNLNFRGTNIEHQITEPINGFTPSSWLNFVLSNIRVAPFENYLGAFPVPMFLRSFPQNPNLIDQAGNPTNVGNPDISLLQAWEYSFTYSQNFHYPQDTLHFTVNFNVGTPNDFALFASIPDAFNQLAEFITVFPSVYEDIKLLVPRIDAEKFYEYESSENVQKLFDDASISLESFIVMVRNIVKAATNGNGLTMKSAPAAFVSTGEALPYSFTLQEGPRSLNGQQVQVVSVCGTPPPGVGTPQVLIEPDIYNMIPWINGDQPCMETCSCFYYINKNTNEPLLSSEAQIIPDRQLVLPNLNILQRQDAMTSAYLTRNENLIPGKKTNQDFVYTTGDLSFSNPLLPTIISIQKIEVADLPNNNGNPADRFLIDQFKVLMATLLKENTEPTLSFQMTCSYDYLINAQLAPISLPVFMQTMVSVELETGLDTMLQSWTDYINTWFEDNKPNKFNGILKFDLTIFSNLTKQPYSLLRLSGLELSLKYIKPA